MTFERDPATVPRVHELARGAGMLLGFNVSLFVLLVLCFFEARDEGVVLAALAVLALHGLWQWAYVLPFYRTLPTRGLKVGVLIGAGTYTFGHAGFVFLAWVTLITSFTV
jgi:hypothetical protein